MTKARKNDAVYATLKKHGCCAGTIVKHPTVYHFSRFLDRGARVLSTAVIACFLCAAPLSGLLLGNSPLTLTSEIGEGASGGREYPGTPDASTAR